MFRQSSSVSLHVGRMLQNIRRAYFPKVWLAMMNLHDVLLGLHLSATLVIKAPTLICPELVLWAGFGKTNQNPSALNRAGIDHTDELLVPVVETQRQLVISLFEVGPRMMYEEAGLKLPVIDCVSFDGFGNAPDTIKLLEEFSLVRRAQHARHATSERPKGELLSRMYDSNATGVDSRHPQGRGSLHR
jgi:hypothetical protein